MWIVALPGHSAHNVYALPSKLFEYTMAGLALCMPALPEMAALIPQYGHGVLMRDMSPETIAATVNDLTPARIDELKRKSLGAACAMRGAGKPCDAARL